MAQNGHTHFKNLVANAARFLECVWPFWDIMHKRVKTGISDRSATLISLRSDTFVKGCICRRGREMGFS